MACCLEIAVLSLFPEYFRSPLETSILKRAQEKGVLKIGLANIRDWSEERFSRVDDRPYGGGPGMVMMAAPLTKAIRAHKREESRTIYLSPQGPTLTAKRARELACEKHLILVCGHYEGIDARVLESDIDEELSIGDYVLTNGCLASLVLIDAVARFLPGVLGDEQAAEFDSFETGLLDWPHYTRPDCFEGRKVPEVLLSGNHKSILMWRQKEAEEKTKRIRPDMWANYIKRCGEKR
jgi:tRNA (guanine37-N1)-methyltransferase